MGCALEVSLAWVTTSRDTATFVVHPCVDTVAANIEAKRKISGAETRINDF